jgi:aminoglycoside/choline kinase family phosphotransferase
MNNITSNIETLFYKWKQSNLSSIDKIPQSGSDRIYYRITHNHDTYIATYNNNIKENKTFVAFSNSFKSKQLPVPTVFCMNDEGTIYIQEDVGNECVLDVLEREGHTNNVYNLFKQSLSKLAQIQVIGHENIDYNLCLTAKEFGKQAILSDLLYFKYYFLDTLQQPYDKQQLLDDFDFLSTYLNYTEHKYFMFRDFQSRNIMHHNGSLNFIDYQGGMKGALQYDVASLLWQAKAQLSEEWKDNLLLHYLDEVEKVLQKPVDRVTFTSQYNGYVLIRLLQVLGAYGFRGLFERKAHFLSSIPLALNNLKFFLENKKIGILTPEFDRLLKIVTSNEIINKFTPPQATEQTPLKVAIHSFSYKKEIPKDDSGNGGGFVFDMRGILNPGRFDEYKTLSGQDKPVQDFLEQKTHMNKFLNSVWDLIDITIEDYLNRGFEHLQINFGCTGGQHRSVYAAEQTARHLRNKYKLKPTLEHLNKQNWKKTL